jgi:hypothetical protein
MLCLMRSVFGGIIWWCVACVSDGCWILLLVARCALFFVLCALCFVLRACPALRVCVLRFLCVACPVCCVLRVRVRACMSSIKL